MSKVIEVTDKSFGEIVLNSDIPVLVDFWAPWCAPCKMLAPHLDVIAIEYTGELLVVKMDVDENDVTPAKYNVRGLPTLVIFRDGLYDSIKTGALTKAQLNAFIDSNV